LQLQFSNFGKKALKDRELGILGTAVLTASLLGINETIALLNASILEQFTFILRIDLWVI